MARKRKDETARPQTAASLLEIARQVEILAADLRTSAEQMAHGPIHLVAVHRDPSRRDGLAFLRTWVDAVRDSVNDALIKAAVSDSAAPVSAGHANGVQPRRKPTTPDKE